jgi:hypothetical protein
MSRSPLAVRAAKTLDLDGVLAVVPDGGERQIAGRLVAASSACTLVMVSWSTATAQAGRGKPVAAQINSPSS